jgi:hypothetical protein
MVMIITVIFYGLPVVATPEYYEVGLLGRSPEGDA